MHSWCGGYWQYSEVRPIAEPDLSAGIASLQLGHRTSSPACPPHRIDTYLVIPVELEITQVKRVCQESCVTGIVLYEQQHKATF